MENAQNIIIRLSAENLKLTLELNAWKVKHDNCPLNLQYGIEAKNIQMPDMSLIPISVEDIAIMIKKLISGKSKSEADDSENCGLIADTELYRMTTTKGDIYLKINQIVCIYSKKNHSEFTQSDGFKINTNRGIKYYLDQFNYAALIKVNKNWAINKNYLHKEDKPNGECILKAGNEYYRIPVSRRKWYQLE
jgi:DNA-binding LytR/AlgR family response regulator